MRSRFEEEGGDLFEVREAILGHLQQGGTPSPFDRIFATRLAVCCIDVLSHAINNRESAGACNGQIQGDIRYTSLEDVPRHMDYQHSRPLKRWWMDLRPIARVLALPGPSMRGQVYRG